MFMQNTSNARKDTNFRKFGVKKKKAILCR